jgi:DNA-binding HxlR family transcriptional regulator
MSSETAPLATCPVERAILLIGGKWKLLVLRMILFKGTARFNELLVGIGGISAKELTRNLRDLEAADLVEHGDEGYRLGRTGEGLMPVFQAMRAWGDSHAVVDACAGSSARRAG